MSSLHDDEFVAYRFLIPPDPRSWASRLEAACQLLESHPALPRERIRFSARVSDNSRFELDDRVAYFEKSLKSELRLLVVTNALRRRYQRTEVSDPGQVLLRADNPQPPRVYGLTVEIPTVAAELRGELLGSLGDALEANSGFHMTQRAWWLLHLRAADAARAQLGHPEPEELRAFGELQKANQVSLPVLETIQARVEDEHRPELLGWINYWSASTAQALGFPDAGRDARLLDKASRTARHAWVWQATPEPLDLRRDDHLRLYAELYQRFPAAGVRR